MAIRSRRNVRRGKRMSRRQRGGINCNTHNSDTLTLENCHLKKGCALYDKGGNKSCGVWMYNEHPNMVASCDRDGGCDSSLNGGRRRQRRSQKRQQRRRR